MLSPAAFRQFLILFACFSSLLSYAQPELGDLESCEYEVNETAVKQVERAMKAWEQRNEREIRRNLELALRQDENYPHALYLYGELMSRKGQIRITEAVWSHLLEHCPDYHADVLFKLGVIFLENGQREKGLSTLEKFVKHPERDRNYERQARKILDEEDLIERLMANPVPFDPKPLELICTDQDEYLAIISPDGKYCFFTRRTQKEDKYGGPARGRMKITEEFVMAERRADGKFERGMPLPDPFNQEFNEGGPSINANNNELYFTVCEELPSGYKNCDIYFSLKQGYYWTVPESVGDHINFADSWESQPSISPNGDYLYFASNKEGGFGGIDLYRCKRKVDGSWSDPENLGPDINTPKDEKSPFIHSDAQTLYFTSNGHPGLGGFDIFYSVYDVEEGWGSPQNIGYPINSKEDDLGLFVSLDGQKGYFSSNSIKKGIGGWDVFSFDLHKSARPAEVTLVKGALKDEYDNAVSEAAVEIKNLSTNKIEQLKVDEFTGEYAAVVKKDKNQDHILTVKKEGVAFSSKFIPGDAEEGTIVEAQLEVKEIKVGEEYRLNDITFPTNSFELNRMAKRVIEEFIAFLEAYPKVKVEIQGHTDNIGSDQDNLKLSKNRAKVVYDYLIYNGIPSSRLSHNGYGAGKPIADNDTEAGRSRNRRTVFVIVEQ